MASVPQPGAGRGVEVDVADEQVLLELCGAGDRLSRVVDDDRVPVEEELVLAADQRAEGDVREVVPGALREHALALASLARVIRRGRWIQQQGGSREGLVAGGRAGLPHVLADREP